MRNKYASPGKIRWFCSCKCSCLVNYPSSVSAISKRYWCLIVTCFLLPFSMNSQELNLDIPFLNGNTDVTATFLYESLVGYSSFLREFWTADGTFNEHSSSQKNIIKIHNTMRYIMATSLWMIFQLGNAARHSTSLMSMNLIGFTQTFFEFNNLKKAHSIYYWMCFVFYNIMKSENTYCAL